jgi:hypothetical protein
MGFIWDIYIYISHINPIIYIYMDLIGIDRIELNGNSSIKPADPQTSEIWLQKGDITLKTTSSQQFHRINGGLVALWCPQTWKMGRSEIIG